MNFPYYQSIVSRTGVLISEQQNKQTINTKSRLRDSRLPEVRIPRVIIFGGKIDHMSSCSWRCVRLGSPRSKMSLFRKFIFLSYQKVKQYLEIISIQVSSAYLLRRELDNERLAMFIPPTADSRDTKKNIHLQWKANFMI